MSESEAQRNESPLLSERGVTTISNTVVSQLAGMAAQEVEGVHMGGGATRSASGVLGSITGSESKASGISVEVGRTETAIDLKMGIEYNKNILQTVEEVRQRITERVEALTGLRIKELNATITDITFPEQEARRRLEPASPTSDRESDDRESDDRESDDRESDDRESDSEQATDTAPEPQAAPESETDEPRETTQVEAATKTEDPDAPEEEAVGEDRPREENETTEVRTEQTVEEPSEETQETRAEFPEGAATRPEPEASDPETPEARMRRRAEERARRRRGSAGDD
jgi:uncharacterized alkaline shock family protein YloU